ARRGTTAEMRAAIPLFNAAADAYDALVLRNNQFVMREARERAERERQAAIDVRAPVAVPQEYNRAETIYQQAVTDAAANSFTTATNGFNQSAPLFAAAAAATGVRRGQAEEAVTRARERSQASIDHATQIGTQMEEDNE
ncbi:MAG: hypothetical protein FWD36_10665, partial [Treponema sp.]|nr:hypothetical protein [Treponema sp.]